MAKFLFALILLAVSWFPPCTTRFHPAPHVSTLHYTFPPCTTRSTLHHTPCTTRFHPALHVPTMHHTFPPCTTRSTPYYTFSPCTTIFHPAPQVTTMFPPCTTRFHKCTRAPQVTTLHYTFPPSTTRFHPAVHVSLAAVNSRAEESAERAAEGGLPSFPAAEHRHTDVVTCPRYFRQPYATLISSTQLSHTGPVHAVCQGRPYNITVWTHSQCQNGTILLGQSHGVCQNGTILLPESR